MENPKAFAPLIKTIRTVKQMQLVERLELDETTAVKLAPTFKELDELTFGFQAARLRTHRELEALLRRSESDEELGQLLDAFWMEEEAFETKRRTLEGVLRSTLTPRQFGQWILFEQEFRRDLGRVLQRLRRRGDGGEMVPRGPGQGPRRSNRLRDGRGNWAPPGPEGRQAPPPAADAPTDDPER